MFLAGLLLLSMTSFSQTTLKIGHVDLTKIMESLPERDTAAAVLERETKEVQATYDEMTVVYNKLLDDYDKGKPTSERLKKTNYLTKKSGSRNLNRMPRPICKRETVNLFSQSSIKFSKQSIKSLLKTDSPISSMSAKGR